MDREYQGGGYAVGGGGGGGGGGGYDGPHRRPYGRSQSMTKHSTPQLHLLKLTEYTTRRRTDIQKDLSQTTPRRWYNGCGIDNHDTREVDAWRWKGQAQVTRSMHMIPPSAKPHNAVDSIPAKLLHSSLNKVKHPINVVKWTPEGRRLLTGSSIGEFTLWNGMGFNFETISQAHDSAVRAAAWSHGEDWLISSEQHGVVKYWQPTFNNVKVVQAHGFNDAVRDLAFSPNDSKFVTASDDKTLKIFDFAAGAEESMLTGHSWDAKTVDWHPSKGLLVSGSKDHDVKLWDPRTGRCLTTLHGHKNTISKTKFEPNRGQLLATAAQDQIARIFDLRMMRDICLLRGNQDKIATLVWHPIHSSLLSTGGADGSICHFLLDEPNTPPGIATSTSIPPYDSADPASAPAQTIYPAHTIKYAHDFAVWSLDWHPLGHILASGSNDRATRFWTRPRPGETDCFSDKYHLGDAAAESQGAWDRRGGRKVMREEEEQELEDEADGLQDQKMPVKQPVLPGIPGLNMPANGASDGPPVRRYPNIANIPPPPPNLPNGLAGMDPEQFKAMIASGTLPPPPPQFTGSLPPPPPNFDMSKLPPGLLPSGFQPPPGMPLPPPPNNFSGLPGIDGDGEGPGAGSIRRRGPLPSQEQSLMEEQRRGKYRIAR